jgi:cytochrome P450
MASATDDDSRNMPMPSLTDPVVMACPYPLYHRLHTEGRRVLKVDGVGYWISGMDDVRAIARDTKRFSNCIFGDVIRPAGVGQDPLQDDVAAIFDSGPVVRKALWMTDPPMHTLHKDLVSRAFTAQRVKALEPGIRAIANDAIDVFADRGQCDFMAEYAIRIPMTVIADALGVPRADQQMFADWCDDILAGNLDVLSHQRRREVAQSFVAYCRYFEDIIAERRKNPRDDMISDIATAEIDGKSLDLAELLAAIETLLLAGNETTKNLIGNGMLMLLERPASFEALHADHARIPNFLEEVLRFEAPVQCLYRVTTEPVSVAGTDIPAGAMVMLGWGSAGRDPAVFDNPDAFDIHRSNARDHVDFGYGPHICIGARLARAEGRIAFETLFDRLTGFHRLDDGPLERIPTFATRGLRHLALGFSRR